MIFRKKNKKKIFDNFKKNFFQHKLFSNFSKLKFCYDLEVVLNSLISNL